MKKYFNVAGPCIPEKHYMVDITEKLNNIEKLIDRGNYFVINRPRQYGKTTSIYKLDYRLRDRYIVISCSFEGLGDIIFNNESDFASRLLSIFSRAVRFTYPNESKLLQELNTDIHDLDQLSQAITTFIEQCRKPVVLFIDEVDKSSNSQLFLSFLGMLRNKFILKEQKKDYSFHSVILSGVHDIKNLKLRIRDKDETKYNSPWNIAVNFDIDLSFNSSEIESMLMEYAAENSVTLNITDIAKEIYKFTSGYPYLVSYICYTIDEKLQKDWTVEGIYKAVKVILQERNTLFDDIIKNIENNPDIKNTISEILVDGLEINYNQYAYEKALIYGLFARKESSIIIHNKIFEELIYNYLVESERIKNYSKDFRAVDKNQFTVKGKLDMEKVLLKFQEVMYEEYRENHSAFYESEGRLIFLAFLKPIINGRGFCFVEPQTRQNKRLDIVILYEGQKEIIELKIWRGPEYENRGTEQLKEYLDIQRLDKGYMLVFNFNVNKEYSNRWIDIEGKKIFEVIV